VQCTRICTLHFLIFELFSFVNFHTLFLSGPFLLMYKSQDLKLHRMIDLIKKKCSAQEQVLCIFYFLSYCPLLIFILYFCPGHFSESIKAMDLKLHRMIDLIKKKCSAQEPVLCISYCAPTLVAGI
jgi:hypothetical protein